MWIIFGEILFSNINEAFASSFIKSCALIISLISCPSSLEKGRSFHDCDEVPFRSNLYSNISVSVLL